MLEKNKDYLEMRISSTDCAFAQNELAQVRVDGYVDTTYMNIPDPDELYVFISKEKFDQLQKKIDELRDDISGRSTVIESYKRDVTRLQARADSNAELARQREINYKFLLKRTGFDTMAELVDYLDSEAECDNLYESISKLHDEVKYTNDKCMVLEQEVKVYAKALQEWKEGTGCPSPSAAKTLIESGASWHHAYNEIKEKNRKLAEEVDSWKNVIGYSTPEDYMHERISGAFHTPFDYTAAWQKATGCSTPEEAKRKIIKLENEAEAWENDYNHLLALTGFDSEGEIEDFLEQNNDRNKLTTVIDNIKLENETMKTALRASNLAMQKELENNIDEWQKFTGCDSPQESGCKINRLCDDICKLKGDYDNLLKLTGYKSEQDIRVLLNDSEQFVYETMRELINSLKRKAKFTESNWQKVTGFSIPEKCSSYIDRLEKKLEDIKNLTEED